MLARVRTVVKWSGVVVLVGLVVVWVGSGWWSVRWASSGGWVCGVEYGTVYRVDWTDGNAWRYAGWWWTRDESFEIWLLPSAYRLKSDWNFAAPLWMPVIGALVVTGAAWWPDVRARRRERGGKCAKCGYDLAGLGSGAVCPECGVAR